MATTQIRWTSSQRGPTKHVGGCGGGDKADALARAKELLAIANGGMG